MIGREIPMRPFCLVHDSVCFTFSDVGESCKVPISDEALCKKVGNTNHLSFTYVNVTGEGHDLPYGCISDTVPPNPALGYRRLYWNPRGIAISNAYHIRQICVIGMRRKQLQPT